MQSARIGKRPRVTEGALVLNSHGFGCGAGLVSSLDCPLDSNSPVHLLILRHINHLLSTPNNCKLRFTQ